MSNFSAMSWQEQATVWWEDDDVPFFTETTVHGYACRSTRTHHSDSKPTSLCSYSLVLHALLRSNKYQFYNFWFDPTG